MHTASPLANRTQRIVHKAFANPEHEACIMTFIPLASPSTLSKLRKPSLRSIWQPAAPFPLKQHEAKALQPKEQLALSSRWHFLWLKGAVKSKAQKQDLEAHTPGYSAAC